MAILGLESYAGLLHCTQLDSVEDITVQQEIGTTMKVWVTVKARFNLDIWFQANIPADLGRRMKNFS